jgi:hypothetical protein
LTYALVSGPGGPGGNCRHRISGASHDASFASNHTSEFFDVTSGNNGRCSSALCRARAGWDGPTGIGSPNGATLAP